MAFDPFGDPEQLLEQGKSLVKSAGDAAKLQVKTTVQTAKQQTTQPPQAAAQQGQPQSSDQTQEFIQDLYGASKQQAASSNQQHPAPARQVTSVKQQLGLEKQDLTPKADTVAGQLGLNTTEKTASITQQIGLESLNIAKTPEEMAKMNKARQELRQMHDSTYFKPTFVEKLKIEEQKEEQEKKQEEMQKEQESAQLEEQKKNESPIALQNAKNKIEMPKGNAG